jgi:hypothetical protein
VERGFEEAAAFGLCSGELRFQQIAHRDQFIDGTESRDSGERNSQSLRSKEHIVQPRRDSRFPR